MSDFQNEMQKLQEERKSTESEGAPNVDRVSLTGQGQFDADIYGNGGGKEQYMSAVVDEEEDEEEGGHLHPSTRRARINPSRSLIDDSIQGSAEEVNENEYREQYGSGVVNTRISDRETEYQSRRLQRALSPSRGDSFSGKTPARSYKEIMLAQELRKEEIDIRKAIAKKLEDEKDGSSSNGGESGSAEREKEVPAVVERKRRRWDDAGAGSETPVVNMSEWDQTAATPAVSSGMASSGSSQETPSRWDVTPAMGGTGAGTGKARSRWDETPVADSSSSSSAATGWDVSATPNGNLSLSTPLVTPGGTKKRSRWDETPVAKVSGDGETPRGPAAGGETPAGAMAMGLTTPASFLGPMTPELSQRIRWEAEIEERNRPLSDEELDAMFPATGYKIIDPPASYMPIRTPQRKLLATPTPMGATPGFSIQQTPSRESYGVPATPSEGAGIPFIKPEDYQYFGKLLDEEVEEEDLSAEEMKERKVMKLLLKIKNGTPPQRKTSMRQIAEKAKEFGAECLFNQILPLLMSPTLEDQERHLLVKVIDRVLYRLSDLVRPYVHKILVVIEPLLIDEDYYARVEGREIISNLAKAAGLATMIATMRPDIDNPDEYVRNTTARAFAVVASALGIPALLPFLKAVCQSRKSWQARHTGIKIVQQIAILMGAAVLPHLKLMVTICEHGLVDEQQKVRTITALGLAALAEAAHPYGIEAFDSVLRPLWKGIRQHRGKGLAAFLKAIGFIIPLMDTNYANYYTKEVMLILIREFQSPDEEMKKIVLKCVKQCVGTDGVEPSYVKETILPEFFRHFWIRRMALDRRNYRQVVETTVEIANKVGCSEVVGRIVDDLKDESEPYRKMVMETVELIVQNLGGADIDERLEEQLIDGILYAFQEQASDESHVMLSGF